MNTDLNSKLKIILESNEFKNVLSNDIDNLSLKNVNHLCSNNSFIFIYQEDRQLLIAININKLAKSNEPLADSIQVIINKLFKNYSISK